MSKLSFRARALDASKPMPIFMAEELPDLPDYSAINRAVPQMPSGMEKEEECEHHLQRAICAGLIIPTPEVSDMPEQDCHDKLYPSNYKQPRQLIHMQPFTMEQDIPDYDMDSEDERWLESQAKRLDLSPVKFEEMMDRLEKSSGQTVVTLNEAKALLKEDDDLIIAVFDYWLNKRLKTQHPLILSVKTEHRAGTAVNNPYLAFRRRTEKMQTRKNRKNDETSYEKMLKLRRDLSRAVTLLEFVKRREKIKREYVHLTVEIFEKRYQAKDFNGAILSELSALKTTRPAFTPIFHNHYPNQSWSNKAIIKDEVIPRKEKRQYKKRKHKSLSHNRVGLGSGLEGVGPLSSDDEPMPQASPEPDEVEDEGQFAFRRNKLCSYHMPTSKEGNWPWCAKEENGLADKRFRYTLTSLANPKRCIGFARRRMGRGGRVILDRIATDYDDYWRTLDYTIYDSAGVNETTGADSKETVKNSTNSFANLVLGNCVGRPEDSGVSLKHEEIKTEFTYNDDGTLRTSSNECPAQGDGEIKCVIKQEPQDVIDECSVPAVEESPAPPTQENVDTLLDILKEVQREWLHFRPKTPPPDYEPPCHLLPAEYNTFMPNANTPFTLELKALDAPSTLLDPSTFMTSPFLLDDFSMDPLEVPVTDTRQTSERNVQTGINLNVNAGLNTLTCTDSLSPLVNLNDSVALARGETTYTDCSDERTVVGRSVVGCSKFSVSDSSASVSNACGSNASGSNVSGSNGSGSNGSGSNGSGSTGSGSNVSGSNVAGSNAFGSNASGFNASGSNVSGSNVYGSNVYGSNAFGSNTTGSNTSGSNVSGSTASGSNASRSNLSGFNVSGSNISGSNASGFSASRSSASGFNVPGSNASNSRALGSSGPGMSGSSASGSGGSVSSASGSRASGSSAPGSVGFGSSALGSTALGSTALSSSASGSSGVGSSASGYRVYGSGTSGPSVAGSSAFGPSASSPSVSDSIPSAGTPSRKQTLHSSTFASPKLNSVNVLSDVRQRSANETPASGTANGLVTSYGIDVSGGRTKNNKMHPYAYTGRVVGSGAPTNTLSLHTSAHTVTLNSHSANILEIPLTNDNDAVQAKVNSHSAEGGTTSPNNKNNKTIVRKTNLVMEVT